MAISIPTVMRNYVEHRPSSACAHFNRERQSFISDIDLETGGDIYINDNRVLRERYDAGFLR